MPRQAAAGKGGDKSPHSKARVIDYKNIDHPTPFLVIDLDRVREKCQAIRAAFPEAGIFYAMKANPDEMVLRTVYDSGLGIEFASEYELDACLALGFDPARLSTANPIKTEGHIRKSYAAGIRSFVVDSFPEVDKLTRWAPGSEVLVRITVDNTGSEWPLTKKFGVDPSLAVGLIDYAADHGLKPEGLAFHVGSQCLNVNNWSNALYVCAEIMGLVRPRHKLGTINLGGGFPVKHVKKIPSMAEIAAVVEKSRKQIFSNGVRFVFEPGRYLVGDAGVMVASVIGKATRGTENWIYIDVGFYNGLSETVENFQYEFDFIDGDGRDKNYFMIGGPTCDSFDTLFRNKHIPEMELGERFFILSSGAYSTACASTFNGFPHPGILYSQTDKII